jgi:hypothetical protein
MTEPGRRAGTTRLPDVLVVVLLLVVLAPLMLVLRAAPKPLVGPVVLPTPSTAPTTGPAVAAHGTPAVAVRATPAELRVPAIDVVQPLSTLGLNSDGTVQVPSDFDRPGWFRLGAVPGQRGAAVILGHVDSYRGPAVFHRLRFLRPGDRVEVILTNGVTTRFEVRAIETYPKERFPGESVYTSPGHSTLQLVTCGGRFDPRRRSYTANVVAYTSLVSMTPPTVPAASPW